MSAEKLRKKFLVSGFSILKLRRKKKSLHFTIAHFTISVGSKKAIQKEKEALREAISSKWNWMPIPAMVEKINRQLKELSCNLLCMLKLSKASWGLLPKILKFSC